MEKCTKAMVVDKVWPKFAPNMQKIDDEAENKKELQRAMKVELTTSLTESLTASLTHTLTRSLTDELAPKLAHVAMEQVVPKVAAAATAVTSEHMGACEGIARVLADLHALGTDEVAQGARKLVRMLSPCQLYYLKALLLDSLPTVCVCVVCCDRCLLLKPCLSSSNGSKKICWDIPK